MNGGVVVGVIGAITMAVAVGSMLYREHKAPPAPIVLTCPAPNAPVINVPAPVVNVAPPASKSVDTTTGKYVCTPAQAEAGECLPLIDPPQSIPTPKPKPKAKPKMSAAKKLKTKWVAPDSFKLEDLFNGGK